MIPRERGITMERKEILRMEHICKSFSGVQVLDDIELTLYEGEVLGLVGENGAGKSTTMNLLTGVFPCDTGSIYYKGEQFSPKNSLDAQKRGISFIHQELEQFLNLTVLENLFIEDFPIKGKAFIDRKKMRSEAERAIARIGDGLSLNSIVGELELGKRQMLEIAKAISHNASVIIFDEPTTSLSAAEKMKLFELINDLRKSGTAIIYISHNLQEIIQLCDRIMVMRDGRNVETLENKSITQETIVRLMVGREMRNVYPYYAKEPGACALSIRNISRGAMVQGASLDLLKGEVHGLFGLMGAGRSELMRCVFGIDEMEKGELWLDGVLVEKPTPAVCIKKGMAFLTENRGQEGLLLDKTVEENLVLTCIQKLKNRFGLLKQKEQDSMSQEMVDRLNIKTYNKRIQVARKLSGGNQQKIVVGKWLLTDPDIFIMDEPTRGIDVGAKAEIYELINNLALSGSSVLMVSSESSELMGVCDRISVMYKGSVVGTLKRSEFSEERLLQLAFGMKEVS